MKAAKAAKVEEEEEKNQFDRLPEEIMIVIFNKLLHAKYLLRCLSVCKRFGSVVHQIETIVVPIRTEPCSSLQQIPFRCLTDMDKFSAVRSVRIDLQHPPSIVHFPPGTWIKYNAVIGARLHAFAAIFSLGFHKPEDFDRNAYNYDVEALSEKNLMLIKISLLDALGTQQFARALVFDLPALCELVINCKVLGKLCMGKDQIVEYRNSNGVSTSGTELKLLSPSEIAGGHGVGVKFVHFPSLELPASDRVMECAIIAVARPEGEEIVMERDLRRFMLGAFGGGEDEDDGKNVDEVVNVVIKKIASDHHENAASIKLHHLDLVNDGDGAPV